MLPVCFATSRIKWKIQIMQIFTLNTIRANILRFSFNYFIKNVICYRRRHAPFDAAFQKSGDQFRPKYFCFNWRDDFDRVIFCLHYVHDSTIHVDQLKVEMKHYFQIYSLIKTKSTPVNTLTQHLNHAILLEFENQIWASHVFSSLPAIVFIRIACPL